MPLMLGGREKEDAGRDVSHFLQCQIVVSSVWYVFSLSKLPVTQIASKDKDFRYMATSDLLNELQKDNFKLDSDTERKVSQIVLQQLDDASGDISGLAVKWFGIPLLVH
jgi:hypothetical protein